MSKFCIEEWQDIRNSAANNKLHAIYPVVGTSYHNKVKQGQLSESKAKAKDLAFITKAKAKAKDMSFMFKAKAKDTGMSRGMIS